MKKIIAIGGGEIGRPGFPIETLGIDKEIVRLSGRPNPSLLFIPTASSDSPDYAKTVEKYFGQKLSCHVTTLNLIGHKISQTEMRKVIKASDIIYVGGGNTLKMMNIWRKTNLNKLLLEAANQGKALAGVSAGAICWFKYGHSDSRQFKDQRSPYIRVSGLNLVPALLCPHYDIEKARKKSLENIMRRTKEIAISLDNCTAIEILGDKYRLLTSKKSAKAYRCFWRQGIYHQDEIVASNAFHPLNELLKK